MRKSFGLFELYKFIKTRILILFLLSATCSFAVFKYCETLDTWYAFSTLIKSGSIESSFNTDKSSFFLAPQQNNFTGSKIKIESAAYIKFKYAESNKINENPSVYLHDIEDISETDYYNIVVYGKNLELAEEFSKKIFSDVEKKFSPIIDSTLNEKKSLIAFNEKQLEIIKNEVNDIQNIINRVGFNPTLLEKKVSLVQKQNILKKESLNLELYLKSKKISLFEIISSRPVQTAAVFPNTPLYTSASFILVFIIFFFVFLIFHQINIEKKNALDYTSIEEDDHDIEHESSILKTVSK
jgi:hypothetical protein